MGTQQRVAPFMLLQSQIRCLLEILKEVREYCSFISVHSLLAEKSVFTVPLVCLASAALQLLVVLVHVNFFLARD